MGRIIRTLVGELVTLLHSKAVSPTNNMSESPPSSWIAQKKGFLILVLLVLVGGGVFNYWLPQRDLRARVQSWENFNTTQQELRSAESVTDFHALLQKNRQDSRSFPWTVTLLASHAASTGNTEALEMLHGEIQTLAASKALSGINIQRDGISTPLLEAVESILAGEKDGRSFAPAQSETGSGTIEITLTGLDKTVYKLSFSLYDEPTAAFSAIRAAKKASLWEQAEVSTLGTQALQLALVGDSLQDPIPLERHWGHFHGKGILCLKSATRVGGSGSEQDPGILMVLNQDAFHFDGRTTVLGVLNAGQADLDSLFALGADPDSGLLAGGVQVTNLNFVNP